MRNCFYHIGLTIFSFILFLNVNSQDTIPTVVVEPPTETADTVYETSPTNNYHFKEASAGNVYVKKISQEKINQVKSDDDYWYANLAPQREKKKSESIQKQPGIFNEAWFKTLFWFFVIAGSVALLIWFLATSNISLFRRKEKPVDGSNLQEVITGNIFEMNFEKEIQKAIDASNYRMAVRLMYLRTLRDLSLHNVINYTHEKTNTDYLFQLAGSPYYKNFFRLTRDFDYTWYGHFPLSQESFSLIQNDFNSFKQQLS